MRVVMKFGGTSVGSAERLAGVAEIVRAQVKRGNQVIVVLSAMSGVTNTLLAALKESANGNIAKLLQTRDELLKKHLDVINALVRDETARQNLTTTTTDALDRFEDLCSSIYVLGEITPRATDAVGSLGERLLVPIATQAFNDAGLRAQWVAANELIMTDDNFVAASPFMDETRAQRAPNSCRF